MEAEAVAPWSGLPERLRVLRGTLACPHPTHRGFDILPDGVMAVDARGVITDVGPAGAECTVPVTRPGAVWLPGFVDTHIHYPQTRVIGRATGPLLEWLERTIFPEEARFVERAYAEAVAEEFCGALSRWGTTTAAVYGSSDPGATEALFSAFARHGLRGLLGMTLMDCGAPSSVLVPATTALAAAEDLIQRWHGHDEGRLRYCVTPRFALSCTSHLMKGAAALAQRHGLWLQTHVAESRAEIAAVAARFPEARDYLGLYADHGMVGDRTLLAHCVWFDDAAWDAVASAGCAVSHCPDSNFFLGSGQMPLAAPLSRGVRLGLGTDVGAGRSFSLRRIVASAYDTGVLTGAGCGAEPLLWLATTGGACALGVGDTVGRLAPGYEADLVAIDLQDCEPRAGDGLFEALAFRHDAGPVAATYVRGRRVSQGSTPSLARED